MRWPWKRTPERLPVEDVMRALGTVARAAMPRKWNRFLILVGCAETGETLVMGSFSNLERMRVLREIAAEAERRMAETGAEPAEVHP